MWQIFTFTAHMTRFLRLPLELLPLVVEQVPVVLRFVEPEHQVVDHPANAFLHGGRCHLGYNA